MNRNERCKLLLHLWLNEKALREISLKELRKILHTNNVCDDLENQFIVERKRARSRKYTEDSREKKYKEIEKLEFEKENLKLEQGRLATEIKLYGSLMKS